MAPKGCLSSTWTSVASALMVAGVNLRGIRVLWLRNSPMLLSRRRAVQERRVYSQRAHHDPASKAARPLVGFPPPAACAYHHDTRIARSKCLKAACGDPLVVFPAGSPKTIDTWCVQYASGCRRPGRPLAARICNRAHDLKRKLRNASMFTHKTPFS